MVYSFVNTSGLVALNLRVISCLVF